MINKLSVKFIDNKVKITKRGFIVETKEGIVYTALWNKNTNHYDLKEIK